MSPRVKHAGIAPVADVVRALARTAGRDAARRSLPTYAAVCIGAGVAFGGKALRPATLTSLASEHVAFRLALWSIWLLVALPAVRSLVRAPATLFLRGLPVPQWRFLLAMGTLIATAELPWWMLWTTGGGPWLGLACLAGAVGTHCFLVVPPRRPLEVIAMALLAGCLAAGAPPPVFALAALAAVPVAILGAWRRGGEPPRQWTSSLIVGPAPVALPMAYLASLVRSAGAVLLRCALLLAIAVNVTYWTARNDASWGGPRLLTLSLASLSPAAFLSAVSLVGPMLRTESLGRWVIDVYGTSRHVRLGAAVASASLVTMVFSAAYGLVVGGLLPVDLRMATVLVAEAVLAGAILGAAAEQTLRWVARSEDCPPSRTVYTAAAVVVLALATAMAMGPYAIALWAAGVASRFYRTTRLVAYAVPTLGTKQPNVEP